MIATAAALLLGFGCWWLLAWRDRTRSKAAAGESDRRTHSKELAERAPAAGKLQDYSVYALTLRQRATAVATGGAVFGAIAYLFYSSWPVAAIAALGGLLVPRYRAKVLCERRLHALRIQFKQALYAVASSLGAGKSVEQAFADAVQDMRLLYPEGSSIMVEELEVMLRRLQLGGTIEAAVADFSRRSQLEDAMHFTDVFAVCKRTGGNLIEIVRRTSSVIGEKLEIEQDIAVLLAQKRFESRVLLAAPVAIVAILRVTAADYMAPLYAGAGRMTMTAALLLLAGCMWLTARLMSVRV
jgi:tight adherence protein B